MTSGDSTVFQFPLLEVQEIVPQLRKLGNILVDENDFKKPDVNIYHIVWIRYYIEIIWYQTNIPKLIFQGMQFYVIYFLKEINYHKI